MSSHYILASSQCLIVRYFRYSKFLSHTRTREKWRLLDRRGKCFYYFTDNFSLEDTYSRILCKLPHVSLSVGGEWVETPKILQSTIYRQDSIELLRCPHQPFIILTWIIGAKKYGVHTHSTSAKISITENILNSNRETREFSVLIWENIDSSLVESRNSITLDGQTSSARAISLFFHTVKIVLWK